MITLNLEISLERIKNLGGKLINICFVQNCNSILTSAVWQNVLLLARAGSQEAGIFFLNS